MFTRTFLIFALCGSIAYAADTTPSPTPSSTPTEGSIKELLELSQSHKLVDSVIGQMENLMQQTIAQATRGRDVPAKIQKDIDQRRSELSAMMKEFLDWKKVEPVFVRTYQKTFSQKEIDGMIAFYKTPAGQAVIIKMPTAMQTTMDEMQGLMGAVMEKMERLQQDIVTALKAENKNKGG